MVLAKAHWKQDSARSDERMLQLQWIVSEECRRDVLGPQSKQKHEKKLSTLKKKKKKMEPGSFVIDFDRLRLQQIRATQKAVSRWIKLSW